VLLVQLDLYLQTILVVIPQVTSGSLVAVVVVSMTPHHKLVKVVEVVLVVLVVLKDLMQVVVMVE
tara:strand:+ start:327 stop:521 length:195 start_codon:yes stop_codon:yes gene_type:complete